MPIINTILSRSNKCVYIFHIFCAILRIIHEKSMTGIAWDNPRDSRHALFKYICNICFYNTQDTKSYMNRDDTLHFRTRPQHTQVLPRSPCPCHNTCTVQVFLRKSHPYVSLQAPCTSRTAHCSCHY